GERNREPDEDQHEVQITKSFYLGMYEVTQGEFEKVMGHNPSWFSRGGRFKDKVKNISARALKRFPVDTVSWEGAQTFLKKLSALPAEVKAGRQYRLPTEAEWEYACRAGAPSYQPFHFGASLSSRQANFDGRIPYGRAPQGPYLARTCKVGSYRPNAWGLYDM